MTVDLELQNKADMMVVVEVSKSNPAEVNRS